MDIASFLFVCVLFCWMEDSVQGQDKTEIANHVIHRVFNGKECNTRIKFDKIGSGKVKVKLGGRMLHFICGRYGRMLGDKFSVCVDGEWSHPIPLCVYKGCGVGGSLDFHPGGVNVQPLMTHEDGDITGYSYSCEEGYALQGGYKLVYCNGKKWQGQVPKACVLLQGVSCDFENITNAQCNWTSDTEQGVIGWAHHSEETLLEGTGPDFDHTYGLDGIGHYMYVDSADAADGAVAELFSPWQHPEEIWCLEFWYHMYGNQTNSTLVASVQKQYHTRSFEPLWIMEGNQGNQWKYAKVALPTMESPFRVLFQATLNSQDDSDIALDDVSILPCSSLTTAAEPSTVESNHVDTTVAQPTMLIQTGHVNRTTPKDLNMVGTMSTHTEMTEFTSALYSNSTDTDNQVLGYLKTTDRKGKNSKTGLVLGSVTGAVLVLICAAIGVVLLRRRIPRDGCDNEEQDTQAFAYITMGPDTPL